MLVNSTAIPPTLCVVIPTRDRVSTVADAAWSVLNARRNDVQVVVVDDGSRDETFARLAEIRDPRLVSCRVKPGGANRARNIGVGLSGAPLIAFLDSDDAFALGRVDRLIAFFSAHPRVDCPIDGFVDVSPRRTRVHRMPRITPSAADIRRLLLAHRLPLTNSAITVRRQAWDAIGGHDMADRAGA
jgi:glycosyltransferase involved in cell wall biosynthesis